MATHDATTLRLYWNGALIAVTTASCNASGTDSTGDFQIGFGPVAPSNYFNGKIDEVFVTGATLTADEIRQAYEVGKRTHPITIDFVSKPQAAVTAITNTSSTYGTVTVDAAPSFPSGGYTTNAMVFKWQREYFDIKGMLASHVDAVTRLTWRVTDGSQGANVWLDDFKSNTNYLTDTTCDTLNTDTGVCAYTITGASVGSALNRYFQFRATIGGWDPAVSPSLTGFSVEYQ